MAIVFKTPKSALNTTTKTIQNLGNGDCPPCPEVNLEAAELEYTQNGEYTVTPEQGVDGFSSIDVTVNIPSDVNNQNKTVNPSTSSQTVEADSGYSGLGTVTVSAVTSAIDQNIAAGNIKKDVSILGVTGSYDPQPTLSNLNITPSTNAQEYNPAISGVDGYSLVRVNAVTASIDSNIQAENILAGVTILGVEGSDEGYQVGYDAGVTDGEATGYQNGYDAGYAQGQSECPEPPEPPVLNPLSVTPTTSAQTIYPDSSIEDGFSDVSVAAVTAAIDANISAGNIKKNITILGVTGSYDPQPELQAKTVNPSTSQQTVTPDQGKDGLSSVTVNAVTSAIDANIQAENILDGVTILGVTGTDLGYQAGYDQGEIDGEAAGYQNGYDDGYAQGQSECPDPSAYGLNIEESVIGEYTYTPDPNDGDYFNEVNVTIDPQPEGSALMPFGYPDIVYETNFEWGYYNMYVENGYIDGESGCYVAEDDSGNTISILPYIDNPDYDPQAADPGQEMIFPDNFDLVGKDVCVQFEKVNASFEEINDPETGDFVAYQMTIENATLVSINLNFDSETWLVTPIQASTRNLGLFTNEPTAMSISSNEPWEIEIDGQDELNPNMRSLAKSGLRAGNESEEPTLEIDQMDGDAGVFTLNVLSTSDQVTGFTVRGLDSGNELHIEVNSMANYFTIESLDDDNTITWTCYDSNHLLEYSTNGGETWANATTYQTRDGRYEWTHTMDTLETVMFRGNNDAFGSTNAYCGFNSTENVNVYGNICSLLRKENFQEYSLMAPYVFERFFSNQIVSGKWLKIFSAGNLILPSGVITERSLADMFNGCVQMTDAPYIPARFVDQYGCYNMFANCHSLGNAPEIAVTTVKDYGLAYMFSNCVNLQNAPSVLPADYLSQNCYEKMFKNCSSLVNAPELPATHLGYRCYWYMFDGCSALETAPELPATTLAMECYGNMFQLCTSLEATPVLAAPVLANNSYSGMFSNCSSLSEVTCLATDISASNCTYGWLWDTPASGTFYKDPNMSSWTSGTDGIPTGWTVEDYVEPSE